MDKNTLNRGETDETNINDDNNEIDNNNNSASNNPSRKRSRATDNNNTDHESKTNSSSNSSHPISFKEQRKLKYRQKLLTKQQQQHQSNSVELKVGYGKYDIEWFQQNKDWITYVTPYHVEMIQNFNSHDAVKTKECYSNNNTEDATEQTVFQKLSRYRNIQDNNHHQDYFIAEGTETIRLLIQQQEKQQQTINKTNSAKSSNPKNCVFQSNNTLQYRVPIESIFVKPNLLFDEPVHLLKDILNFTADNTSQDSDFVRRPPFHVFVGTESVMSTIGGFPISRGAVACGRIPTTYNEEWLMQYLNEKIITQVRLVVLDGISDSANLGSIIRTSSAFGIDAIILSSDCCSPWYRRSVRVSMGHTSRIPCIRSTSLVNLLQRLSTKPYNIVSYAAVIDPNADLLLETIPQGSIGSWCCVIGNEANGITENVVRACSNSIRISMEDGVDSLSAPIATGIILHGLKEREATKMI